MKDSVHPKQVGPQPGGERVSSASGHGMSFPERIEIILKLR